MGGSLAFLLPMLSANDPVTAVMFLSASFFFLEITNPVLWTFRSTSPASMRARRAA